MCSEHQHHSPVQANAAAIEGVTFQVADMTCDHCAGTIRKAIEVTMPGSAISIDLGKHHVTVGGDATLAAQAIREAGYEPQLLAR